MSAPGVQAALDAGAVAAVVGTRFLLSDESRAHPGYKQRCVEADATVITELFGRGWPDSATPGDPQCRDRARSHRRVRAAEPAVTLR